MEKEFNLTDIPQIATEILALLEPRTSNLEPRKASIVALSGDLGAGKTTLSQAIARELGVKENVASPTFVIMKIYELEGKSWKHLIHIDAYRLESSHELEKLGWQEIIADPQNLILIEWPEKVVDIIPKDAHRVFLSHKDDQTRSIRLG